MKGGSPELHLSPPKVDQLRRPQAVPVGHKDHRGVSVTVTVAAGGFHEPFDLGFGEMLTSPHVPVWEPPWHNCSFYDGWRDQLEIRLRHTFGPSYILHCSKKTPFTNSLRSLFVAGAFAVIRYAKLHGTKYRPWVAALLVRRPTKVAAIALAK